MTAEYGQFKNLKEKQNEVKKEERAGITMVYYDKVSEMIDSGEYPQQESFLYSVQQFIEEKEYISEKQIQVVDRIYNEVHDSLPF